MATKKMTSRSADAVEGNAAVKRATRAKRTGINATNAMDAASRARRAYIPQNARAGSVNPTAAKRRAIMSEQPATKNKQYSVAAKAKATGQTKESSMDAVGRRFKTSSNRTTDGGKNTLSWTSVKDRVTGKVVETYKGTGPKGSALAKKLNK
jgi:hypothetical protein